MHNPDDILENKMHKHLWDFEIQTDYLISARTHDNQQNKRKPIKVDFGVSPDHRVKLKESEKRDKYRDLVKCNTDCDWYTGYSPERICTGTGRLGNKRRSGDAQNYSMVEIGQNYREESKRFGETYCHSKSKEKPFLSNSGRKRTL